MFSHNHNFSWQRSVFAFHPLTIFSTCRQSISPDLTIRKTLSAYLSVKLCESYHITPERLSKYATADLQSWIYWCSLNYNCCSSAFYPLSDNRLPGKKRPISNRKSKFVCFKKIGSTEFLVVVANLSSWPPYCLLVFCFMRCQRVFFSWWLLRREAICD